MKNGITVQSPYLTLQWHQLRNGLYSLDILLFKNKGIFSSFGYDALIQYIEQKHNLTQAKLDRINLSALQEYLCGLTVSHRASTSKVIHDWIPTYSTLCRQGCEHSPLCPRCSKKVKTCEHIRICQHSKANLSRRNLLDTFLGSLVKINAPLCKPKWKVKKGTGKKRQKSMFK